MKKNLSNLKMIVAGMLLFASVTMNAQFTAVMSGNWSSSATWGGTAPSSTVTGQNITIPTGITVTLDADVTFTGLLNTFLVNGALTGTTNAIYMTSGTLSGSGSVNVGKLKFSALATTTYGGSLTIRHMINTVTNLAFVSMANVSDTLDLESGSLNLNTNGNLTMSSGSTVKIGNGSMVVNAGVFNSGNAYNVMYTGSSKNSGVELNSVTVQNIYLKFNNNSETLTLNNNAMVNGNLDVSSGKIVLNGKKLTLKGDLMMSSGAMIVGDNAADLEIMGSGAMTSALMISGSLDEMTINRGGNAQVKLGSSTSVKSLRLIEGTFSIENGVTFGATNNGNIHIEKGTLTLNSGSFVSPNAYNVEYAGTTDNTTGVELSGTGLSTVTVNYISNANKIILGANTTLNGKLDLVKGKLDLNGKILMLNFTFMQSTSAWIIGSASSELHLNLAAVNQNTLYFDNASTASQTLGKLKINTSGANSIVLGSKLWIANELTFAAGKLELGNGDLEIMPSASITGYDDTKYIITSELNSGILIQNVTSGGSYMTFPIGLSSNYSPAYVQQNSAGATGNFSAKCHSLTGMAGLKAVNRMWMVEGAGVTNVDANLKFGWKSVSEINSFDRTNAYVSHFTSGSWDLSAAASASAGVYSTYELSRNGLTSLSPFAVVENGQPVGISHNTKLSGIEMYPNPSKDFINFKVVNSTNEYQYELIDVTGRTILTTSNANTVNKFDVSNLGSGCYFVKITNLSDNKSTTKRFVKQ